MTTLPPNRKYPCPPVEWDETGGLDAYTGIAYLVMTFFPDLHRDVVRQLAYHAGYTAHEHRDEYLDNFRIMRVKEPEYAYHRRWKSGCCGESNIVVITSGAYDSDEDETEMWLVGWNHGH